MPNTGHLAVAIEEAPDSQMLLLGAATKHRHLRVLAEAVSVAAYIVVALHSGVVVLGSVANTPTANPKLSIGLPP